SECFHARQYNFAVRGVAAACALFLTAAAHVVQAQDLVTPVRVGRADAPMTLSVWAQQDYSHLAARPAIANVFADVFADWAREVLLRPDAQGHRRIGASNA